MNSTRSCVGAAILFWVLSTLVVINTECRFPGTDVFLFKEAGIQLASHGTLTAKNLNYMPFEQELPYANYTPVYPFVFGVWSSLVGIGLKESLFFECLLRGLRSFLLGLLVWPLLGPIILQSKKRRWVHFFIFFLSILSLISTDSDRPDEMGIIFGLLSWIILVRASKIIGVFWAAIFLGLCAATSPACGVAFGLGFASYFVFFMRKLTLIGIAGVGTLMSFLGCTLPIFIKSPGMYTRFLESARVSSMTYLHLIKYSKNWADFSLHFKLTFERYYPVGEKYIFCALFLFFLSLYVLKKNRFQRESCFLVSALVYLPISFFFWGLQPYYLWFSCLPLAILSFSLALKLEMPEVRVLGSLIVLAFGPLFLHESKNFVLAFQMPESQRTARVRERLLKQIKPNERVALSADQFFTLKNDREVADLNFVCRIVEGFDFIYATDMRDSRRANGTPIHIPCWAEAVSRCFVPIDDLSLVQRVRIFAWESPYSVRGHGGILYKNVNCPSSLIASKTVTGIKKARATKNGSGLIRLLSY